MAEAKDEKEKESTVALGELKASLDSFTDKFNESLSDVNTRLDGFQTKFDEFKPPETKEPPSFAPETETYVPKGWLPSDEGGWNDVLGESAKISKNIAKEEAKQILDTYKEELKKVEEEERAANEATDKFFDDQEKELEKQGRIPKIENPDKKDDPGKLGRQELYRLGMEYGSNNLTKMADLRDKLKKVPPTGAEAPVGSSTTTTEAPSNVPKYEDIHLKDMETLAREEFPKQ